MEVILKFFANDRPPESGAPTLVSKTLGKISIISRSRRGSSCPQPKPDEFWRCRILKELKKGQKSGCFLVEPMEQIDFHQVVKLLPGMYTTSCDSGKFVVIPTDDYRGKPCILPLEHKTLMMEQHRAYCAIVDVRPTKTPTVPTAPTSDTKSPYVVRRR